MFRKNSGLFVLRGRTRWSRSRGLQRCVVAGGREAAECVGRTPSRAATVSPASGGERRYSVATRMLFNNQRSHAALAQFGRARPCHGRGHRFEPDRPLHTAASQRRALGIRHMKGSGREGRCGMESFSGCSSVCAESSAWNREVVGSNPTALTTIMEGWQSGLSHRS